MRGRARKGESWLKRVTANAFYRVIGRLSTNSIPESVGEFRLLSRLAVPALSQLPEQSRFIDGLFAWIGDTTHMLTCDRDVRFASSSSSTTGACETSRSRASRRSHRRH